MPPPVHQFTPAAASALRDGDGVQWVRDHVRRLASARDQVLEQRLGNMVEYAAEVQELYAKGFTCHEISHLLNGCGVQLPTDTIRSFLDELQFSRMLALELKLTQLQTGRWNSARHREVDIEQGLRAALRQGHGLALRYQPQVDSRTGEVVGAEALLRWRHEGTLVMPSDFIPVAEESDLIVVAGEWVLREACREAKRWRAMGLGGETGIRMSVNLSVKQLSHGLADLVHGVLCDAGLPTNLLGLEITESAMMDSRALDVLDRLSESGIHLSLDDFGTGYSGLSRLKDMPLDTVKIDQSFVRALGHSDAPSFVVEAIVSLAGKLSMATVAEGVETLDQVQALARMGCTVCQGFYFSTPLSADAFVEYAAFPLVHR